MDALIKLGLELPGVLPDHDRIHPHPWLDRFLSVQEWIAKAFESIKDLPKGKADSDLAKALETVAPWVESAAKVLPPAHFLVEIVKELTKENDPRALAILACTVAYQSTAQAAIAELGLPGGKAVKKPLGDSIGATKSDFSFFTLQTALSHPFIRSADQVLEFHAAIAGYTQPQIEQLVLLIHDRFPDELRQIITSGEHNDKFSLLRAWLSTDSKESAARAGLRRHVQYSKWLYEEAPVLDHEPYALKDIYIDTGCGILTRQQLMEKGKDSRPIRDPFRRDEDNGGTSSLLDTVLGLIRDSNFNDAIVIQGSAGSGKSTFTKCLSATLANDGLHPIRIRLRDVKIGRELFTILGEAIQFEDETYLRANPRWQAAAELLKDGNVFQDEVSYRDCRICPYILILDGWDEISLDVTDGFKQKVKELLDRIRSEFFGRGRPKVRVILTGRPSDAIDASDGFFYDTTPVLTIRPLHPDQLDLFADKLRTAMESRPLSQYSSDWTMPKKNKLKPLAERYRKSFEETGANQDAEILGIPFLAQLAFRVIANPGSDGEKVVEDATTLLRRLTEITIANAAMPTDNIGRKSAKGATPPAKVKNRIQGDDLRNLLQQTAAKMTIAGRESVSHAELEEYLVLEGLEPLLAEAEKANVVTALMIAFFFKGGNLHLGCEFTHKALREYLFAEAVLECIKGFAARSEGSPNLPERQHYWRDFDPADPRQDWSRQVARLLAPQWLTTEVMRHLSSLIAWELNRAEGKDQVFGSTKPLTVAQWQSVRNAMADLWDWWAEGVAMRPQVVVNSSSKRVEWEPAILQSLIEQNHPLPKVSTLASCVPPRLTTYDGHLGAALMQLTAIVHFGVALRLRTGKTNDQLHERSRAKYQTMLKETVAFSPSGAYPSYFKFYCARINAAGWYLSGNFPSSAQLPGLNLRGVDSAQLDWEEANLMHADLSGAYFGAARLTWAFLVGATIVGTNLSRAGLDFAVFTGANLTGANLNAASVFDADFTNADLTGANVSQTDMRNAILTGAKITSKQLAWAGTGSLDAAPI